MAEFSLADFLQTDHLHIFVARVTQYAAIELVDHRTFTFEHLQEKPFALAQDAGDLVDFVKRADVRSLLVDSVRWDLKLPYVRREVANFQVLRNKEDARATFTERHKNS